MPHQCALQLTLKWLGAVQDKFPLRQVGVMTLNRNVDNWFNDNEVVAFNPGNMPPGLLASDDKLLQSRIFSYSDAQRYRCLHPRPPLSCYHPCGSSCVCCETAQQARHRAHRGLAFSVVLCRCPPRIGTDMLWLHVSFH